LKNDGWKTILSCGGYVKRREGIFVISLHYPGVCGMVALNNKVCLPELGAGMSLPAEVAEGREVKLSCH